MVGNYTFEDSLRLRKFCGHFLFAHIYLTIFQ